MSSEFGKNMKVTVFGQSHGKAIGVVMDNLPAGEKIDEGELLSFLKRRKPGGALSTQRKEEALPIFLSGVVNGRTCGSPLCAIIHNKDARSADYDNLSDVPRPSHADYAAFAKWGRNADLRGGGHFSGRLTAPLCVAGGIAKQILARRGIFVGAHLQEVGGIKDAPFPLWPTRDLFEQIAQKPFPVIDDERGEGMKDAILQAAKEGDSVGGVIECAAIGLPEGLGSTMFDGVENRIASAVFGIPAVKGIEFGAGFASAKKRGSENNDPFFINDSGRIVTQKNDCGGILGGITNGMPLVFCAAFKPTPSIAKPQRSISLSEKREVELTIVGRHDPCIAHRAVPVVEAVAAIVILDMLLEVK
jgi:chorismate synthase